MLLLNCPYCGIRGEETEFSPGGEAHIKRAAIESSDKEFEVYLFSRKNPKVLTSSFYQTKVQYSISYCMVDAQAKTIKPERTWLAS